MMRKRIVWSLLSAAGLAARLGGAAPARAQGTGPAPGAEAAARQLFAALDSMRWDAAAALFHPTARDRFHDAQLRQARAMERYAANPPRFADPEMPPAVAAWMQRRDSVDRARYGPSLTHSFARVTSVAQLDSLPAGDLLARWLEAHDERVQFRSQLTRLPAAVAARFGGDSLPRQVRSVLGSVLENDSTAQVVVRTTLVALRDHVEGPEELSVLTLRRTDAGWRAWTADDRSAWLGVGFSYSVDSGSTADDRARRLDAVRDSTLAWRDAAGRTRMQAAIVGYPGRGKPPRGLLVEVRAPDGTLRSAEIPFAAFEQLMGYMMLWVDAAEDETAFAGR